MAGEAKSGDAGHRYQVELNVADEATKAKIHECIEKRGKITISTELKGFALGGNGGFDQRID
jgi:hypothetical protein